MSDQYDLDVVEWSERQADLLRRLASGEKVSQQLDWANIIDELESMRRSQRDAVESLWTLAFLHDLKAAGWPQSITPAMRPRIDFAELYTDALEGLPATLDDQEPLPSRVHAPSPWTSC